MDAVNASEMSEQQTGIISNGTVTTNCSEATQCSAGEQVLSDKLKADAEGFGLVSQNSTDNKETSENGKSDDDDDDDSSEESSSSGSSDSSSESEEEDGNEASCDGSVNNSKDGDDDDDDDDDSSSSSSSSSSSNSSSSSSNNSKSASEITHSSGQVPESREESMDVSEVDPAECKSGENTRDSAEQDTGTGENYTGRDDSSSKGETSVPDESKTNENSKDATESNDPESCVDLTSESNENTTDSVAVKETADSADNKTSDKEKNSDEKESSEKESSENNKTNTSEKENAPEVVISQETPEQEAKDAADKAPTKPTKVDRVLASDKPRSGNSFGAENLRPFARLLFDLGLDLTRQHVYKDLIRVQTRKQQHNKLNNKDEKQLDKLKDAYTYLVEKNKYFALDSQKCPRCDYKRESINALEFHKEFDHRGACTLCDFVTGNASAYYFHMEAEHNRQGRVEPVLGLYVCPYCPYEHHNARKNYLKHVMKCEKAFILKQNLKPMPADCDIPLKTSPMSIQHSMAAKNIRQPPPLMKKPDVPIAHVAPAARNLASSIIGGMTRPLLPGQLSLPPWLNIQESQGPQLVQMGNQYFLVVTQNGQTFMTPMTIGTVADMAGTVQQPIRQPKHTVRSTDAKSKASARGAFEICEICGGFVKDRDSLRIHFFWAHKIEIHPLLMKDREPALKCTHQNCSRRFWTYQGYQRHVTVTHGGEASKAPTPGMTCYVCGVNTVDFITHMTSKHPQVVKHMLSQMRCVVCQDALPTETALESHMFIEHKDVVTKYGSLITGSKNIPNQNQDKVQPKSTVISKGSPATSANSSFDSSHVECLYCDAKFNSSSAYAAHFSKQHANIKESCSVCKEDVLVGQKFIDHVTDKHLKKLSIPVKRIAKDNAQKTPPPTTRSRKRNSEEVIVIDLEDKKRQRVEVETNHTPENQTKRRVTRNSSKKVTEEVIEVDGEQVVIQKVDD